MINAKYRFALSLMEEWGYEIVDEISWVKRTVNRRLAKSHGFYLMHAKETCLVARKKGKVDPPQTRHGVGTDVIFSERRGQSQKPEESCVQFQGSPLGLFLLSRRRDSRRYELVEQLVPGGFYLEIFARRNNLRDRWVSVGNEL